MTLKETPPGVPVSIARRGADTVVIPTTEMAAACIVVVELATGELVTVPCNTEATVIPALMEDMLRKRRLQYPVASMLVAAIVITSLVGLSVALAAAALVAAYKIVGWAVALTIG
jgi:hypothetical protein